MTLYNGFTSKAAALRYLREKGFQFGSLLAEAEANPKVAKNQKQGVYTAPLHLAPHWLSGFNTCASASEGCAAACLHTAGNPLYMAAKETARIARTKAYFQERAAFMALLAFEIESHCRKAERLNMQPAIRLNATSDLPFERRTVSADWIVYDNLMALFPNVEFYDYTKQAKRALQWASGLMPSNYHLTFSKSESNDSDVAKVLAAGGNVAVVFDTLPETYLGKPVVDGDETDFRPLDPKGVVVGLKAKGDAKGDESGFVVRVGRFPFKERVAA